MYNSKMDGKGYKVRLPLFEGPLDLLLHLISGNKIDIYDIPIAGITRQYLDYLELMKELNLDIAGEFLVMAATLIQIKTRMLLPVDEDIPPEEREDPRIELVERLLEYQAFKDVALALKDRRESWADYVWREPSVPDDPEDEGEPCLFDVNIYDLIGAFKKLLDTASIEEVEITRETLTVKDRMNLIVERIDSSNAIRFEDVFEDEYTRDYLIVTFLALLELLRLGVLRVYQERPFGRIWLIAGTDEGSPSERVY
ncbi:segregation and condensation protein A [bacterium BMS3Abin08]|nr:segregation and condensation protein A [bacterium BMS3Abin08]